MTKQSKFIYFVFYAIHSKTQYAPSRQILCHEGLNRITEQGSFLDRACLTYAKWQIPGFLSFAGHRLHLYGMLFWESQMIQFPYTG